MKGGVVRKSVNIREQNGNYFHDDRHACHYFLENSRMQILSNSTISAITFRCTLNDNIVSPFVHVRSGIFNTPVRQLFIKCLPTWDPILAATNETVMRRVDNGRSGDGWGQDGRIEINTIATVQREASMQHQIYCGSFYTQSHICDPVCPSILSIKYIPKNRQGLSANQHTVERMLAYIRTKLVARTGNGRGNVPATLEREMAEIRDTFLMNQSQIGISIIIMEMMDGYLPIPTYINNIPRNFYISNALANFEFKRLARVGFSQMDINQGNYMINPTYNYIPNYPGRVILIDFGRAEPLTTEMARNNEFARLDRELSSEPMPGTITMFTYEQIVEMLVQKNQRILQYLTDNNINIQHYIESLGVRRIVGGTTNINNENDNDNDDEIIKQFLNNQPIDIIKQLLEMHKERMLKVGDVIDNFYKSNINKNVFTKLLISSNDENKTAKKNYQPSIQNKTTKKIQQSPLNTTIFNNSDRLMIAGKKAKPFSRTKKNKRT